MSNDGPILSVCIPTYNRARLLESALHSLAPQLEKMGGEVELVISDNCSPDHTPQLVSDFTARCKHVRGFRNETNLGVIKNIQLCIQRAQGEFVWMLGDDDLVREDALERLLGVIKANPDVDFVFANVSLRMIDERERFDRCVSGADFPDLAPALSKDFSERILESWNELIDPAIDGTYLTSVMVSVFRRSVCLEAVSTPDFEDQFCTSLFTSCPHPIMFARTMVGRKAFFLGRPIAIAFGGHWEWSDYISSIWVVRLNQLLDLYLASGIEKWRIDKCRRALLFRTGGHVFRLLLNRRLPGRELFSFRRHIARYWRFKELWIGLFAVPIYSSLRRRLPRPRVRPGSRTR